MNAFKEKRIFYEQLKLNDLKDNKCWRFNFSTKLISPVDDLANISDYQPIISYTRYTFYNGDCYEGYRFVYDDSGNRIFFKGKNIELSVYCTITKVDALVFCKTVSLPLKDVFPVTYKSFTKCFESSSGVIDIGEEI